MPGIYLSAASKSSGKTTVSTGLCAALSKRGETVQPFKKGPDYIDPMWLAAASSRSCYNLDFNTQDNDEILELYRCHQRPGQFSLVEGNKGLFDGVDVHGSDSNAAMAKLLELPVILVVDTQGITRGVAPLLNGYQSFDPEIHHAGVILNKVGGSRHEGKLRNVIEQYTDFDVLGAVPRDADLVIPERHLGLATAAEDPHALDHIDLLGRVIENSVDLDRVLGAAGKAQATQASQDKPLKGAEHSKQVSIAVARDSAFCFYYPDDFETMESAGAKLLFFDTLNEAGVPDADALFIGGGFPEIHCGLLEQNQSMKQSIARFVESGKPVYAECGGLMYLARSIRWQGKAYRMVGAIPADIEMTEKPVGRGHVELAPTPNHPWYGCGVEPESKDTVVAIRAHEFHYSRMINLDTVIKFAYDVKRGYGADGSHDGVVVDNIFASYAHLRSTRQFPWATLFINHVRQSKHNE
jgi:cobyrinic acid a,c-diamide synthase